MVSALLTGACEPRAQSFVGVGAPVTAIVHVRVIDGTDSPGKDDQTLVIRDGRIHAVGDASVYTPPPGAHIVDGRGRTLIPGLVGMHEHLFYQADEIGVPAQAAFARLYLASGVTTIRTAGTVDFKGDLRIKQRSFCCTPYDRDHDSGLCLHRRRRHPHRCAHPIEGGDRRRTRTRSSCHRPSGPSQAMKRRIPQAFSSGCHSCGSKLSQHG